MARGMRHVLGRARTAAHARETSPAVTVAGITLADLRASASLFWRDNVPGMAGMIAFFGFLAVIPLALLFLALVGSVLGSLISVHDIRHLFHAVMPGLNQKQFLDSYWKPIRDTRETTTVLGVLSLLFGTLGLHDSVDWAVNRLWRSPGTRAFWVAKIRGAAIILWVTLFVFLSLALSALSSFAFTRTSAEAIVPGIVPVLAPAYLLDVAIFTALYKLTPSVPVQLGAAFRAGVLGATLWEVSKVIFAWWVLDVSTYNRVYESLAASVIVMLWLWISAMIFLYGAGLSAVVQRRQEAE